MGKDEYEEMDDVFTVDNILGIVGFGIRFSPCNVCNVMSWIMRVSFGGLISYHDIDVSSSA